MYNTKFVCTYNSSDSDSELSNTLYRKDLLQIFNVNDFDFEDHEEEIYDEMCKIFEKIEKNEKFMDCINKAKNIVFADDPIVGFMILFSYDYLHLTHLCISEFLETNEISTDKIELLLENIVNSWSKE